MGDKLERVQVYKLKAVSMQPKDISLGQRNVLYSSFSALVIKQMNRNTDY